MTIVSSSANIFVTFQMDGQRPNASHQTAQGERYGTAAYSRETLIQHCSRYTNEIVRAVRLWSPDYISVASPFIACTIIGPEAVHVQQCRQYDSKQGNGDKQHAIDGEMLELVIKRFADYWRLGSMLLGTLQRGNPSSYP